MFTNWPGHSLCSGFGKEAFIWTVPVVVSIWLLTSVSVPSPSSSVPVRGKAFATSGFLAVESARLVSWTASSGNVNSTEIGSIWLITTRPVVSAA